MKKIQIIITLEAFVPNPKHYEEGSTIEQMAEIEKDNAIEEPADYVGMTEVEKVEYKIVE